jgi:hypothetical protein
MSSGRISSPLITKERGSWAVLSVPMFVSASVAGKWTLDFVFLSFSALAVFMSYVPVHNLLRHITGTTQQEEKLTQAKFWAVAYLFVGVVFIVPLLMKGYTLLLAIGALGAISFFGNFFLTRKYSKTIASDLIAVAGLTLSAPSAYYVLTQAIDRIALVLYILNFLFFGCSVFYVHMKIRALGIKKSKIGWSDKLSLGKLNLFYHGAVMVIVGFLVATQFTAQLALIAFVPMLIHGVYGTLNLSGNVCFKNLGLLLLGQSVLFGILLWFFAWR